MPNFSIAIDDALLLEFFNYKNARQVNTSIIDKILHLYKPPYITNTDQLARIGNTDKTLIAQLTASGLTGQTLEQLSDLTCYKVILTDDSHSSKAHFPYLNVHNPLMVNNYCLSANIGAPRNHIHNYLKGLFKSANNILIHDQHFESQFAQSSQIFSLVPTSNSPKIFFSKPLAQQNISNLKTQFPHLSFPTPKGQTYPRNLHDRYILIDRRIEIIISSGVDYIFDNSKECLLIVRLKQN